MQTKRRFEFLTGFQALKSCANIMTCAHEECQERVNGYSIAQNSRVGETMINHGMYYVAMVIQELEKQFYRAVTRNSII